MQVVFLFQSALTATLRESNGAGFAAHTVHIRKTGAIRRPGCENCDERSPASAFSPLFRLFSLLYTTIFLFFVIGNEKYIIFGKMEYIRISNNDASFSVTMVHRFR